MQTMILNLSQNNAGNLMTYAENYGTKNVFIEGGGSFVGEDGSIALYGNAWKAYSLETPFGVNGNTHISFEFELIEEAEGHAICVDENTDEDTFGGFQRRCIALAGTEFTIWNERLVKKIGKVTSGTTLSMTVRIGDMFAELGHQINYIAFVQDNDNLPLNGVSRFRNIRLFNVLPVSLLIFI